MDNNYGCDLVKMGNHISELRKEKGFTQKKLAELIDVNDKSISKWEQGNLAPDITVLKPLADTLGVTLDEILCGERLEDIEKKKKKNEPLFEKLKRMKFKIFAYLITLLIMGLFILVIKNNEWKVREVSYTNQIHAHGTIISNSSRAKLFFYDFYLKDDDKGLMDEIKLKDCLVRVIYDDMEIYSKALSKDEYIYFNTFLNELFFEIDVPKRITKDYLKLELSFTDETETIRFYEIHF